MALTITTSDPKDLLASINKAIDDNKIQTWSYDKDGDFSHTPEQWKGKAWLRPKIGNSALEISLVAPKDTKLTKAVTGVYQGRFIEMIVTHFESKVNNITASI